MFILEIAVGVFFGLWSFVEFFEWLQHWRNDAEWRRDHRAWKRIMREAGH
jgi:hypothetical protein